MAIRVQEAASLRLDDIYRHTRDRWGEARLTATSPACSRRSNGSRPIPAEFGVEGFFFRYEHHFIYWRRLSDDDIGIVAILHERMHQIDRFKEDFRD